MRCNCIALSTITNACVQAEEKKDPSAVIAGAPASAVAGSEDTTMADVEKEKLEGKAQEQKETAAASSSSSPAKRRGIVLAAEKKVTSKLLDKDAGGGREKIFSVNE